MWIFIKLAWRNILRFKRRTFITFISSSFGLAMLVVTLSLMNGIDKDSMNNIINSQQSHLTLYAQGYYENRDEMPLDPSIADPEAFIHLLLQNPVIEAVESRIRFAATLINGSEELPCLGIAVEPARNPFLFNIKESLISGAWLADDEAIVLGKNLADDMGLKTGDLVTLRLITSSDEEQFSWNALDVTVKGIYASGNPGIDRSALFLPLKVAQRALSKPDQATEIALKLKKGGDQHIASLKKALKPIMANSQQKFDAYSWKELENTFLTVSEMKTKRSSIIIMVMLLIATVGIVNTMLMAVMERTREIGMLSAMGLKRREIMTLFTLEGGIIGIIGAGCGCVIGGAITLYLKIHGLSMTSFGEAMTRMSEAIYPIKGVFYADLSLSVLLMVFIFGTLIALLASAWPACKAAKMDPIQALRHI